MKEKKASTFLACKQSTQELNSSYDTFFVLYQPCLSQPKEECMLRHLLFLDISSSIQPLIGPLGSIKDEGVTSLTGKWPKDPNFQSLLSFLQGLWIPCKKIYCTWIILQFYAVCFPPCLGLLGTDDVTFIFLALVLGLLVTILHFKGCKIFMNFIWWVDDLNQF